jgi:hypothetical protein
LGVDVQIVPATREHAINLAPRMRQEDIAEVWVGSHQEPLEHLTDSIERSVIARSALVGDQVACIWGVVAISLLTGTGQPWLLTSDLVERHPRHFMREVRRQLPEMLRMFPTLLNVTDARYTRAIRWLDRIGFQVSPPFLFGPVGYVHPHRLIEMRA